MKFNSLADFGQHLNAQKATEAAAEAQRQTVQAQMDAMWEARKRKLEADRKAQMNQAWYLR